MVCSCLSVHIFTVNVVFKYDNNIVLNSTGAENFTQIVKKKKNNKKKKKYSQNDRKNNFR